ncbi:MAG: hypothetical protein P8Y02_01120 [Deinococcales bacterium]
MRPWLAHPFVRHLRLHFNVLLSPIYLWGVLLGGGRLLDGGVWLGYLSLHLFLYGGTTAFNSYYDRDEGPVGGMPALACGLASYPCEPRGASPYHSPRRNSQARALTSPDISPGGLKKGGQIR